jgi:hypothetical protein
MDEILGFKLLIDIGFKFNEFQPIVSEIELKVAKSGSETVRDKLIVVVKP